MHIEPGGEKQEPAVNEFQEVRCPECNKLLFKVAGLGARIEIVCARCGTKVLWPSMAPEIVSKKN